MQPGGSRQVLEVVVVPKINNVDGLLDINYVTGVGILSCLVLNCK